MASVIFYAALFVVVFSLIVFIVLFGPAPRFRYVTHINRADFSNTPIGLANRILTHDVPRVVQSVDGTLTGGRLGKVFGYVFSARTPLIMVPYPRNLR